MGEGLVEGLPGGLVRAARRSLADGEMVKVALKGVYTEALICTDRRVMIVKKGLFAGRLFGSDVFQAPYGNVTSAEISMGLFFGYLEISAGGVQNTPKSFWSNDRGADPNKAPNCVGVVRTQVDKFRAACSFILDSVAATRTGSRPGGDKGGGGEDLASQIERLWRLHERGAMSLEEYQSAKERLVRAS